MREAYRKREKTARQGSERRPRVTEGVRQRKKKTGHKDLPHSRRPRVTEGVREGKTPKKTGHKDLPQPAALFWHDPATFEKSF